VNPGLRVLGVGSDLDVLPELRVRLSLTYMAFDDASSLAGLEVGRRPRRSIGAGASLELLYRPLFINNVVVSLTVGSLRAGPALEDLFRAQPRDLLHSVRAQLILRY